MRKSISVLAELDENPIFRVLNPSRQQFLNAKFLSSLLNPFAEFRIGMAALTLHGLSHIKTVPSFHMMVEDFMQGRYDDVHTIVVDSSGNTAEAVARLAIAFDMNVKVILSADTPQSKIGVIAVLPRVEVITVPGSGVAARAIEESKNPGHAHLNQYTHAENARAHQLYTGPEVWRVLDGKVSVIAIALGSSGTALGVGRFLREQNQGAIIVGVRPVLGEQVPGARDEKRMHDVVTLPWQDVVDTVVEVSRKESFFSAYRLWSEVEPRVGPSSGLAYAGLVKYLRSVNPEKLETLRNNGNTAFICPDGASLYSDLFRAELDL